MRRGRVASVVALLPGLLIATLARGEERADLTALLEPLRRQFDLPALAGSIVVGERTVAIGAAGVRARGSDDPVSVEDRWHLGSCTKAMTATLAAMLVDEGKLGWDTRLGDVFPDETAAQPAWRDVTVEQLLAHRSGLPTDRDPSGAPYTRALSGSLPEQRRQIVRYALSVPPSYPPGTALAYANTGYIVVGAILEQRTGRSWEDLMRARLFEPLGMASAGFGPPRPLPQPQGHFGRKPRGVGRNADNVPALGPAGTVHASLADWGRFVSLHLEASPARSRLVRHASLRHLHTPIPGSDFALGWLSVERPWGGTVITHSGSNTLWFAVVWAAPEQGFAVLAATNEAGEHAARATDEAAAALIRHYKAKLDPDRSGAQKR